MSISKDFERQYKWHGALYPEEIALAREVYEDTLPYERIFFSKIKSHTQGITIATSPFRKRARYFFLWNDAYRTNVAYENQDMKDTFIHELAHVWQSQYAGISAMSFMTNSIWQQFRNGTQDVFKDGYGSGFKRVREMYKKGFQREWDYHRNMAYQFNPYDIGKDFREFNVEQQAILIQSWYTKHAFSIRGVEYQPGNASILDRRFSYIRDCIRKGNSDAAYFGIDGD